MDFRVRFFLLLAPQIIIFGLVKGINNTKTCMTQQCNISALGYSIEQKIQKPETMVGYTNLRSRRVAKIYPRGRLQKIKLCDYDLYRFSFQIPSLSEESHHWIFEMFRY